MFPSIEASEVGSSGLLWLFFSYGYVLYQASGLIAEGSDLLLLIPSYAGLVGGVVLPLLGAVPDGAIMLFSGLGDIEEAQESLSVGVGALAGSTIMLITVPWALSVFSGRVNISPETGKPNYARRPKLSKKMAFKDALTQTGVGLSEAVGSGANLMVLTIIPYFLIQVPGFYYTYIKPDEDIVAGEYNWAILGFLVCSSGFVYYLYEQFKLSVEPDSDTQDKIVVNMQTCIEKDNVSLRACVMDYFRYADQTKEMLTGYKTFRESDPEGNMEMFSYTETVLRELVKPAFYRHDSNKNGILDGNEIQAVFYELNEKNTKDWLPKMFEEYDTDKDGSLSLDEFVKACYGIFLVEYMSEKEKTQNPPLSEDGYSEVEDADGDEDEEEAGVHEKTTDLPADEQQRIIKKEAFSMLALGTFLVVTFSDPMVDVIGEIANRIGVNAFYVSFILVPLASNGSELLASVYYAKKKTSKTMKVALTSLEGAACMNNTFCLAIFMALIAFRGLAWQYTAETIAIIIVELAIAFFAKKEMLTYLDGWLILSLFPLSIVLVASLEAVGFD